MAISLVSGGALAGGAANGGNVTINLPTLLPGDVVIGWGAHWHRAGANVGPQTAGYSNIYTFNSGAEVMFGCGYKVMGATPDTTFVGYGSGNAFDAASYAVYCLRSVRQTGVIDAGPAAAVQESDSTNPDPPSVTVAVAGSWVLALAGGSQADSGGLSAPSGYSNLISNATGDDNGSTVGGAIKVSTTSGAENPATFTQWASMAWVAITVSIRPALSLIIPGRPMIPHLMM